jgi:phosphoglycolate phosphatase
MSSTDLVVFDLDGVLVDSREANVEAFSYGIEFLGYDRPASDRVVALIGRTASEMLAELGCPAERVREVYDRAVLPRYLECLVSMARPMPGAHDLLEKLTRAGIPVAACTSGGLKLQDAVLRQLGLRDAFHDIQAPDLSTRKKPDPHYLGELVTRMGSFRRVVHVEDLEEGCLMGRRFGAVAVFAEYGYGRWSSDEQPDHRIHSLAELEPILFR